VTSGSSANRELGADFDPGAFDHVALWEWTDAQGCFALSLSTVR
jgi:uncharacterized SAM-dependent methyltransferase